jgi:hypothetical protein
MDVKPAAGGAKAPGSKVLDVHGRGAEQAEVGGVAGGGIPVSSTVLRVDS